MIYCSKRLEEMKKRFVLHSSTRTRAVQGETIEATNTHVFVRYSGDYDIISLDEIVTNKIREYTALQLEEGTARLVILNSRIENSDVVMEMRELDVARTTLQLKLVELKNEDMLNKYIASSSIVLSSYRDIPFEEKVIDIMNTSQQALSPGELAREKVVDNYMDIVSQLRLPTLTVIKEKRETTSSNASCHTCGASLLGCNVLLSGLSVCSNCGSTNKPRTSSSVAKEYDVLANLMKAHKRYMCITPPKCDLQLMMSDLDTYFVQIGDFKGEYYRALPLDDSGKKAGTSREKLCAAMKVLGYGDFYKNYMYICHHYYGWKVHDLRHIEADMIRNFRIKQDVWDNNMTSEEKGCQSSISTEYRLCREYQHAGHKCELADFGVSKKKRTIERYDKSYAIMCQRAGFGDVFSIE